MASKAATRIGLGGGCHWCTEAVFQSLGGVEKVEQGFIHSDPPEDSWSEAVIVTYDPDLIPLDVLIEIHLRTHSSTSHHKMRGKYRSAVYVFDVETGENVDGILRDLQSGFEEPLVTRVLAFAAFKPSDERFQNYYATGPDRPFCKTYIDPKLAVLRRDFGRVLDPTFPVQR
jgi:peptide-methionine (S)-S-oxide reductase